MLPSFNFLAVIANLKQSNTKQFCFFLLYKIETQFYRSLVRPVLSPFCNTSIKMDLNQTTFTSLLDVFPSSGSDSESTGKGSKRSGDKQKTSPPNSSTGSTAPSTTSGQGKMIAGESNSYTMYPDSVDQFNPTYNGMQFLPEAVPFGSVALAAPMPPPHPTQPSSYPSSVGQHPNYSSSMQPIYVNPKQFNRILIRRQNRARIEKLIQTNREKRPYLHESRHRHAMKRPRGPGGRFLTASEFNALKSTPSDGELNSNTFRTKN